MTKLSLGDKGIVSGIRFKKQIIPIAVLLSVYEVSPCYSSLPCRRRTPADEPLRECAGGRAVNCTHSLRFSRIPKKNSLPISGHTSTLYMNIRFRGECPCGYCLCPGSPSIIPVEHEAAGYAHSQVCLRQTWLSRRLYQQRSQNKDIISA